MKAAKKIILIATIAIALVLAFIIFDFVTYTFKQEKDITKKGETTAIALRDQIDAILINIENEGNRLAEMFGSKELTAKQVEEIVKESSLSIAEIQGVTACYEPYAFSKKRRLYCPYYDKNTSDYFFVGKKYDYSIKGAKGTAWYTGARDNGAMWNEPYFGEGVQDWFADYSVPFYFTNGPNKGKVRGTITLSFVLGGFKELVHKMSLGKTGYGMIISPKGKFLVHPINDYIGRKTIDDLIKEEESKEVINAYENIVSRLKGRTEYYDSNSKSDIVMHYDKIKTSNWGFGLVFFKKDLLGGNVIKNEYFMKLLLFTSLLILCLMALWFLKDMHLDIKEIWQLSIFTTILLMVNLILVCALKHFTSELAHEKSQPITSVSSLNSFVNTVNKKAEIEKQPKFNSIPTGIYIERMDFNGTYTIGIAGKIWQKYPPTTTIDGSPEIGIHFPQIASEPENLNMEEVYRELIPSKEGSKPYLLIGWNFSNLYRLNLNYSNYPFDRKHIDISFQPIKANDYLIFTPDLASYKYTNPSRKSGINPEIEISGHHILDSYFNFSLQSYDADFGFKNKALFEELPTLHYNMDMKRRLLNSFVTYLIPILITLIMTYILIHSIGSKSEGQGIIEAMAAFFFVLVFSHIDLRRDIGTSDLMFMEFFYFSSYFMLIATTFNLFMYTKKTIKLFNYKNNLVFKAIFFPIYFLIILVVAYLKFY